VHARTKRAGAQLGEVLFNGGDGGWRWHDYFKNKKDEAREELRLEILICDALSSGVRG
jgi:hypothetical protein